MVIGGLAAATRDWGLPAVLFAAESLVHATRAASTILGREEPRELDELMRIEATGQAAGLGG